jgi:hypothetical protein
MNKENKNCFNCHKLIHSGYNLEQIKKIIKKEGMM